jgi:hypothetical protein
MQPITPGLTNARGREGTYVGSGGLDVEVGLVLEIGVNAQRAIVGRSVLALLQHHVQSLGLCTPSHHVDRSTSAVLLAIFLPPARVAKSDHRRNCDLYLELLKESVLRDEEEVTSEATGSDEHLLCDEREQVSCAPSHHPSLPTTWADMPTFSASLAKGPPGRYSDAL